MLLRRRHYRRRLPEQAELDMTTFLNLMVVLVPFLLITAVFSRITVVELDLPSATGGVASGEPQLRIEVIVRDSGLELRRNDGLVAALPRQGGDYDLHGLGEHVIALKRQHPDHDGASVLLEPLVEYDHLIQVMDVVRSAELPVGEDDELAQVALFRDISIGDAP